MKFKCNKCDMEHDVNDFGIGWPYPNHWHVLSDFDRARSVLGDEQCEIDSIEGKFYYIKGNVKLPIKGRGHCIPLTVWVSLSESNYTEYVKNWDNPLRTKIGPYFGWLSVSVPLYPETMNLKTMLFVQELGNRPNIEVELSDHRFSMDCKFGMSEQLFLQMFDLVTHGG